MIPEVVVCKYCDTPIELCINGRWAHPVVIPHLGPDPFMFFYCEELMIVVGEHKIATMATPKEGL